MDILIYIFTAAAIVAAGLAALAIWAPRPTPVRIGALIVAVLFLPIAYVQSLEMLSRAKPASFEWFKRTQDRAQVLSVSFDEGRKIYLWLRFAGSVEPRAYEIPWNIRLAEKLEDAVDDAVRKNSTIIIKEPFYRRSMDEWGDLNVEIIPPPLPPQKLPPALAPKVFNPRKGDSI